MESRKIAALIAYVGGLLLIIAGTTGSTGIAGTIINYLIENLGGSTANLLSLILQALTLLADLGGISVIMGGTLIIRKRTKIGKLIIGIGAGMGLIGFLMILASALLHGWIDAIKFIIMISQSIGWIGIILSIIATRMAK